MAAVVPSVPPPTKAEWQAQATEVAAVLSKGNVASARLVEQLMVDAVALVALVP